MAVCASALLLLLTGVAAQPQPQTAPPVTLSIIGTNDLHGGLAPDGNRGGLALFAGYVKNLRAVRSRDGGAVLLIDAGDMFQGTLESNLAEGAPVVAAYNALGYTAAAIGNHDFDYGPTGPAMTPQTSADDPRGALKARASEARFPFLAANLLEAPTGMPVEWPNVKPSVVVDAAGIKVGIVGVMTRNALTATIAANTRGLSVGPVSAAIASQASMLRAGGATVVIAAAHVGGTCTRFDRPTDSSSCDASSEIIDVARTLPPGLVDVIVAGHTHAGIAHEIQGIQVTEAFSGGRAFGRVDLTVNRASGRVTGRRVFRPQFIAPARYEGRPVTPDAAIAAVVAPALERVRDLKAASLGVLLQTPIRRVGRVESPLGNLFTDAFRDSVAAADIAMNNTRGGLRADLPAGPLTYGSLYEVFPFDNRIVRLTLSGREVRQVVAAQLRQRQTVVGISGFRVDVRCSAGAPVVTLTRTSGVPIRDDERLLVVTTDFLATGGDSVFAPVMPPEGFALQDDGAVARDVVADWFRKRGGALRADELVDDARPRWVYPGPLPLRCAAA